MMKIINSLYVCVFELSEKSISQTCKFFTMLEISMFKLISNDINGIFGFKYSKVEGT